MKRMHTTAAALAALLLAACADREPTAPTLAADDPNFVRAEATFRFRPIEVPDALFTVASGINARGDIVGWYGDAAGKQYGFLLRGGRFTTIDYPGAARTDARGIGPDGTIVGAYAMPGEPGVATHGYRLTRKGKFIPVDYPGHLHTIAQRILPDGTIVGCRHDNDMMASMRGIVMSRRGNHETDAFASMHNGATPGLRRIVGLYTNMMVTPNRTEGYVIDKGVFRPFMVPGSGATSAWDVNPRGDVVGIYRTGAGVPTDPFVFHGFLRTGDRYTSIDVPGATATRAFGINAYGIVVGSFVADSKTRGFVAIPGDTWRLR